MAQAKKKIRTLTGRPAKREPKPHKTRTPRLPGMEDSAIEKLEELAKRYDELRVERTKIKSELIDEMKAQHKTKYVHGAVEITIGQGKETVTVHVGSDESVMEAEPAS